MKLYSVDLVGLVSLSSFQFYIMAKKIAWIDIPLRPNLRMSNRRQVIEIPSKVNFAKQKTVPAIVKSNTCVQTSGVVFDPIASTPPSDFIHTLKMRMDVYFTRSVPESSCVDSAIIEHQ
jgi:hypothetical protein